MAYATAAELALRYPTRLAESELSSHFLPHASTRLEALLATYFTVPFSDNNATARDLTLDLAYLLILQRSKEPGEAAPLAASLAERIAALAEGRQAMVTTSGETLWAAPATGGVWSSTAGRRPVFDLGSELAQRVDPERLRASWEGEP
jgi:hypothetical protein